MFVSAGALRIVLVFSGSMVITFLPKIGPKNLDEEKIRFWRLSLAPTSCRR